jgi:hypothetical protein
MVVFAGPDQTCVRKWECVGHACALEHASFTEKIQSVVYWILLPKQFQSMSAESGHLEGLCAA